MAVSKCVKPCSIRMVSKYTHGVYRQKSKKIVIMDICIKVEGRALNLIKVRYTWQRNMVVMGFQAKLRKATFLW